MCGNFFLEKTQKAFFKILRNLQKYIFARVSLLAKLQAGNLKLPEAAAGDGMQPFKRRLRHRCFLMKFANFLRTII